MGTPVNVQTIVLAGGRGKRLRPHTDLVPKPLLPVGKHPILYHLLQGLRRGGVERATLAVGYRADLIEGYFGAGEAVGVALSYAREDKPMGTAGPIRAAWDGRSAVLAVNGDILTDFDYGAILAAHARSGAALTAGLVTWRTQVRFGAVEREGTRLVGVREKPDLSFEVLAGIYALAPSAVARIPADAPSDLPQLIGALLADGERVEGLPIGGRWLDVGVESDLERAREDALTW